MNELITSIQLTMDDFTVFHHPKFGDLRILTKDQDYPLWVAVDVCRGLGISNSRDAISSLKDDEKITVALADGNPRAGVPHQITLISEPGYYRLVHKSRTPLAEEFQHWNFHEVLPSIRKTGRYSAVPDLDLIKIESENKRLLAISLQAMANSGLYTPVRAVLFHAEAASALSGKPMLEYLPPVAGERDKWPTPTQLAERFGTSPKRIGMILKAAGLHGSDDVGHRHSEPYWNITPHSERQVISYKYDPEVVGPAIRRALGRGNPDITLNS